DVSDTKTIELHAPSKAKYSMDNEMEDKICDFYDIYVQGMNQIKSSEIRKFYIQILPRSREMPKMLYSNLI
nr:wound-responsive family protein isoform 1 [Tanacetum cinerariifolium]